MTVIPLKERFFETIDSQLFVFEKALEKAGVSVNYFRKEKSSGNTRIIFLDHPQDKRFNLVSFDTLSDNHKAKVLSVFPNPHGHVVKQTIITLLQPDDKAEQFFLNYTYGDNQHLSTKKVKQYTRASIWMNLLKEMDETNYQVFKGSEINVPAFYNHVKELMNVEKEKGKDDNYIGADQLPGNWATAYENLRIKLRAYLKEGCSCLISKHIGNTRTLKVNDEYCRAHLTTLIEDERQLDDVAIAVFYNIWSAEHGYKTIDPRTVCNWRMKLGYEITTGREGRSAFNEKYIREVKGKRPSQPLYLCEHDDNSLDFLFKSEDGYQFNKYISIVVTDSHCDLAIGKSYCQVNNDMKQTMQHLIHHAYIDAMYYIRSLTGGWYLPFEIKSDRWALSSMLPFYKSIGKYVKPGHGNKHRGYIEQKFRTHHWKRAQQLVSQGNWTANNMTAKYSGVNPDMLEMSLKEKSRPMVGKEAELQIENFFHLLRKMPDFKRTNMNAPCKEEQWLENWNKLPIEKKRPITDEQFLLIFGIQHAPQERQILITNRGVEPQIGGIKYSYDLPESWMYKKLIGEKVWVIYDPYDMSRVLITDHDKIRFIAKDATRTPRALEDAYTGSRTYLNAILEEKKDQVKDVADKRAKRKELVTVHPFNAEAILKGGAMIKELKMDAEQKMLEQFTDDREKYLDDNVNFNEYL